MATSLETRVPLLDHRVFEFVWSLPLNYKIRHSQGNAILRKFLYRHVLKKIIERLKARLAVPIDKWLRGLLKEWEVGLLDEKKLRKDFFMRIKFKIYGSPILKVIKAISMNFGEYLRFRTRINEGRRQSGDLLCEVNILKIVFSMA